MPTPDSLDGLINKIESYLPEPQIKKVLAAFEFGSLAHAGQTRKSGGLYIWHPVAVAEILADIKLDYESLIAAILHDVIEDTPYTKQDIIDRFGENVAEIIDGVTKLGKLEFSSPQEAQAESFRKMMLAMVKDLRVILIKLADRLHNMRTLGVMRPDKQRRIARETLDIYAPIAARLGLNPFRVELEDLGFKARYPRRFAALELAVKRARGNRNEVIGQITETIVKRFEQEGLKAEVVGREKHLYSLYKKMLTKRLSFEEVLDIFAFRIIVEDADSCYRSLGIMHSLYKPLPGKFKDYIAIPKPNGYQSLHTFLFGPFGAHIEIQIRSQDMHDVSEHGIAAHWQYKDNPDFEHDPTTAEVRAQQWVKSLLEMQQSAGNSLDFLENVKVDLFPDVIYVFTPDGDIVTLPRGSTAVDFAYAVHTNLGHITIGCRINRNRKPLRTQLQTGQTIEIIKGTEAQPSPAWLNFVVTPKARTQIRSFLKVNNSQAAKVLGRRLLAKALISQGLSYDNLTQKEMDNFVKATNLENWEAVLEEIGLGQRPVGLVTTQLKEIFIGKEISQDEISDLTMPSLSIAGSEGMLVTYAQCCRPIPGDDIIGFISTGKGLVIHRQNCKNVRHFQKQPDKWLDVSWDATNDELFPVSILIEAKNERGTLARVASEIAGTRTDIESVSSEDKDETYSQMNFVVLVRNREHLDDMIRQLSRVPIIEKIYRIE